MIDFLASLFSLVGLLFKEFFSAEAEAKKRNAKFVVDQASFKLLTYNALAKLRANAANESAGAGNVWDKIDEKK